MIGQLFKGLFGATSKAPAEPKPPELYEGYEIFAEPVSENGQWRISGRIEKEVGGERKVHVFIRADMLPSETEASEQMVRKAKILIDQQGESIFR